MQRVVGVVFRKAGKVYYFDPDGLDLKTGQSAIVRTSRGMEFGEVVAPPQEMPDELVPKDLKKVVRRANDEDMRQVAGNKTKEEEAFKACQEKIAKHNLDMKLVDVEYVFDGSKALFYFTSEQRVDFRDLVKDLASILKTRIEMRQIGVRDEAKMIGGLGPCGRRLCCTMFAGDFEPVSIRMAKEQNLPLNPMKISGICGRLMCCLKYEYEVYKDFRGRVPKKGTVVTTPEGTGKIVDFNVPREYVTIQLESGMQRQVPLCDVCAGGRGKEKRKSEAAEPDVGREAEPGRAAAPERERASVEDAGESEDRGAAVTPSDDSSQRPVSGRPEGGEAQESTSRRPEGGGQETSDRGSPGRRRGRRRRGRRPAGSDQSTREPSDG